MLNAPLRIYSYRQPVEAVEHGAVRLIRSPVQYLPDPLWKSLGKLLGRASAMRKLEPLRFRKTVAYVGRVSIRDRSIDVWKRLLQALYLAWDLRQEKVAHVHAHFAHQATQVAMLASMLNGISFSFTGHAKDVYTARPRNLKEKVEMAAFAVTCTGANQTYLRSLVAPVDREKIELAYHGVDIEKFSPDIGSSDSDEAAPLVLSVGRLVAKRGLLTSLRLWRASEQTVCSFARCLSERDRTVECWSNAGGTRGSMMFWKCPAPAARRPWSISIVVPLSSRCHAVSCETATVTEFPTF